MPLPLRALAQPLPDAELLRRYARDADPAAFEVLVWRHGPLVLGVCRRHLRDAHAADDAFQATWLVLARKAAAVRPDTLPGWLHRVARRTAVRAAAKTRRRRETPLAADPPARPGTDPELGPVLDAEIDRLPDRLRQVVALCYLEGASTESAAARLGIPRGTVLSRLHAARATLRTRLLRRGVTPPAVGLTAAVTASQVAGGVRATTGANAAATLLASEVISMTTRKAVLAVAMGLVLAGGAGTGWGVLTAQPGGGPPVGKPEPVAGPVDRLRAAEAKLDRLFAEHQQRAAEQRAKPGYVDPAALRAALVNIGEQMLTAEFALRQAELQAAAARKRLSGLEGGPLDPAAVERWLQSNGRYSAVATATRELRDYKLEPNPDPEMVKKFESRVADAEARYQQDAKRLRKKAELAVRDESLRNARGAEQGAVSQVDIKRKQLAELSARRDELAKRLADQTAVAGEDELEALRDLRRDLSRRRLSAELDLPPDAATAAILARLAAVEMRLGDPKK